MSRTTRLQDLIRVLRHHIDPIGPEHAETPPKANELALSPRV